MGTTPVNALKRGTGGKEKRCFVISEGQPAKRWLHNIGTG